MRQGFLMACLWVLSCGYLSPVLAGSTPLAKNLLDKKESPNNISDLYYRDALFYTYQADYFTAISHLLSARHSGKMIHEQRDFNLFLADLYLLYGLRDKARSNFERHANRSSLEVLERDAVWLALAESDYCSNDMDGVAKALAHLHSPLSSPSKEAAFQFLQAQWLLAQGRRDEAINAMAATEVSSRPYEAFNAAIFLLKNNAKQRAIKILREIISLKGQRRDNAFSALKDQTHLLLSELFYNDNRFDEASQFSLKIWSDSLFYTQAQLELGWAVFERGEYKKAIAEWERANRYPFDRRVQSILLAIPYAYLKLDDYTAAEQTYKQAIQRYVSLSDEVTQLRKAVESANFIAMFIQPENEYNVLLAEFFSQPSTALALSHYHDLQRMLDNLKTWKKTLKPLEDMPQNDRIQQRINTQKQRIIDLDRRVKTTKKHWESAFKETLQEALDKEEKYIHDNISMARYGLAFLHDQYFLVHEGEGDSK